MPLLTCELMKVLMKVGSIAMLIRLMIQAFVIHSNCYFCADIDFFLRRFYLGWLGAGGMW